MLHPMLRPVDVMNHQQKINESVFLKFDGIRTRIGIGIRMGEI